VKRLTLLLSLLALLGLPAPRQLYRANFRDKLCWLIANTALRLATPDYRNFIRGAILTGLLESAAKDAKDKSKTEGVL
jgi:hypothetical protein